MTIEGTYVPSPSQWVREQIEAYERSGGTEANTLLDTGIPVIIVTMKGRNSGNVRKIALMRVEHDGEYALVASMGGAPTNPVWYYNLVADPRNVTVQDGPAPFEVTVREVPAMSARCGGPVQWRCSRTTPGTRRRQRARFPCSSPHRAERRWSTLGRNVGAPSLRSWPSVALSLATPSERFEYHPRRSSASIAPDDARRWMAGRALASRPCR